MTSRGRKIYSPASPVRSSLPDSVRRSALIGWRSWRLSVFFLHRDRQDRTGSRQAGVSRTYSHSNGSQDTVLVLAFVRVARSDWLLVLVWLSLRPSMRHDVSGPGSVT